MSNVVKLSPRRDTLDYFWLALEVALEFLRDDDESNMVRSLMRDGYPRLKAALEADTAEDLARWAMLRYAIHVCAALPEVVGEDHTQH